MSDNTKGIINDIYRIVQLLVALGCMVAAIASFIKNDPTHIPLAYIAGGYVLAQTAREDFLS